MSSSLDHQVTQYGLNNNNSGSNNNNNSNSNSYSNNAIDSSSSSSNGGNNSNSNGGGDNSNNGDYHLGGYQPQQPNQQQQQRHPQHQQQQQFHQQQQQHDYHQQSNMHPQRSSNQPNQQNQQQQRHPNQYGQQQQQQQNQQRPTSPYGPMGSQQQQNNNNSSSNNTNNNDNNNYNSSNNSNNNSYGNNNNNSGISRQNNSQQHNQGDYIFRGNQQQFDNYGQGQQQQPHHYQNQSQHQPQQQPQQHQHQPQARSHDSAERGSASVSVSGSSPPRSEGGANLRFKITLEAQTAAMQRQDETPVTYLNKGQFYTVVLADTEEYDGDITSVIKVTFHDASHRRLAARYWSFWLSQQSNPKVARALDIEKASSSGMMEVQSKTFDRISFKWNGKAGAKLMVRFNCLSTDFSRIKGVKGIPLRVHMDTTTEDDSNGGENSMERSFAKIKLFRDKGAERKNKDDHKHLEKMWDKMRGKNADTNPLVNMLAPVQSVSLFSECMDHPEGSGEDETLDLSETLAHDPEGDVDAAGGEDGAATSVTSSRQDSDANRHSSSGGGGSGSTNNTESDSLVPVTKKRRRGTDNAGSGSNSSSSNFDQQYPQQQQQQQQQSQIGYLNPSSSPSSGSVGFLNSTGGTSNSSNNSNSSTSGSMKMTMSSDLFLDRDPSYVPQTRKKRPVLCLYIKIGGESVYRAVYLEKYTLTDLIQKLSEKLEIQSSTISCVYRKTTKKELMVRVDDSMVAQMTDELDMVVDYDFNQMDGSVNLTLKY